MLPEMPEDGKPQAAKTSLAPYNLLTPAAQARKPAGVAAIDCIAEVDMLAAVAAAHTWFAADRLAVVGNNLVAAVIEHMSTGSTEAEPPAASRVDRTTSLPGSVCRASPSRLLYVAHQPTTAPSDRR